MKLEDLIIETMANEKCNKFQLAVNIADFVERFISMMELNPIKEWRAGCNEGRDLLTHTKIHWMVSQFLETDIKDFGLSEDDEMPPCNNVGYVLAANIAVNLANALEEINKTDVKIGLGGKVR